MHAAVLDALTRAVIEGLPAAGPRGGVIWTARSFVRRAAWHVLDHAWEIEAERGVTPAFRAGRDSCGRQPDLNCRATPGG